MTLYLEASEAPLKLSSEIVWAKNYWLTNIWLHLGITVAWAVLHTAVIDCLEHWEPSPYPHWGQELEDIIVRS